MPRPKKARRGRPPKSARPAAAPAPATTNSHDDDGGDDGHRGRTRARTRATRSGIMARKATDEKGARGRDAALDGLAEEEAAAPSGHGDNTRGLVEVAAPSGHGDNTRGLVEMGRRAATTPSARRDTTGLDLADDSVFGDLGDGFADGDVPEGPPSGASSSATLSRPRATRPRSRQSSMIGRHDPPIRPSSRTGGNTPGVSSSFNIGVFLRRAREPSILGASRHARSRTGSIAGSSVAGSRAGSVVPDSDLDLDSDGDLGPEPEAESTPSERSRRRSRRGQDQKQVFASPCPPPSPEHPRRWTRKRKSEDDAAAQSGSAPRLAKISRVEANGGLVISSDAELSDSPSPSPPPAPARIARPVTPVNMDEVAAPPASSDSEADDKGIWPDIHTLAKRRRRPSATTPLRDHGDISDVSTPPSLTHSPNLVGTGTRTRGAASKQQRVRSPKMTTADLTSMLPKRSYRRVRGNEDAFDIESDGSDGGDSHPKSESSSSSDGEAAYHEGSRPPGPPRRRGRPPGSRGGGRAGANAVVGRGRSPATTADANKTYRRSEDKENDGGEGDEEDGAETSQFQPLPEDTFDETGGVIPDVRSADELVRAARKFVEVDRWELSYEEVAGEEASPEGAR